MTITAIHSQSTGAIQTSTASTSSTPASTTDTKILGVKRKLDEKETSDTSPSLKRHDVAQALSTSSISVATAPATVTESTTETVLCKTVHTEAELTALIASKISITELTISGLAITDTTLTAIETFTGLKKLSLNADTVDSKLVQFSKEGFANLLKKLKALKSLSFFIDTTNKAFDYSLFDLIQEPLSSIESLNVYADELALATAGAFGYKAMLKMPNIQTILIAAKKFPVFSTDARIQKESIEYGISALIATIMANKHKLKKLREFTLVAPDFENESITFTEDLALARMTHFEATLDDKIQQSKANVFGLTLKSFQNPNWFVKKSVDVVISAMAALKGFPNPKELDIDITNMESYKKQAEENMSLFAGHVTMVRRKS